MKTGLLALLLIGGVLSVPALAQTGSIIQISGGINRDVSLLSVPDDGSKADLFSADDGSGRQHWLLRPGPDGQWYNILIGGGIRNDRKYLSTTSDGSKVDLFSQDDGSGRQRWVIEKLPGGPVHIRILGGVQNDRRLLSVTSDGKKVDLFSMDDGSGRQRWKISGLNPNATPPVTAVGTPGCKGGPCQPVTGTEGYPLPPPGTPDGLNGRQITLDLNGDWEGNYMSPGLVTDIRIHHTGGHLTAEVLNIDLNPTGQQFFRGDFGEKRGVAQVEVSNSGSWNRETLNVVDLDHVQIGSRPPFQRITMPRRGDTPCSSKNDAGVGAPWAGMRGRQAHDAKDYHTAACWFYVAAVQGDVKAQLFLAYYLDSGVGMPKDPPQAFRWAMKSAEGGFDIGAAAVAVMYRQGDGVLADPAKAQYWRARAKQLQDQERSEAADEKTRQEIDRQTLEAATFVAMFGVDILNSIGAPKVCYPSLDEDAATRAARREWLVTHRMQCVNGQTVPVDRN